MKDGLKIIVIHPVLFALYPVLSLCDTNISQMPLSEASRALVYSIILSISLFLLLQLVLRNWHRSGLIVTYLILLFYSYGHIRILTAPADDSLLTIHAFQLLAIWSVFTIIGVWALIRLLRHPQRLSQVANWISIGLVLFNLVDIGIYKIRSSLFPSQPDDEVRMKLSLPKTSAGMVTKPDIYYIILDGYARSDILNEVHGFDNTQFIHTLESQGFYVASDSHSNYAQTILSVASSLNSNYLYQMIDLDAASDNREPVINLLRDSSTMQFLKSQGYRILTFDTGSPTINIPQSDKYYQRENQLNHFESILLDNSMAIFYLTRLTASLYREDMLLQYDRLEESIQEPGPKFVFAHFIMPHPPFTIDHNGDPLPTNPSIYGDGDGSSFLGTDEDYTQGYVEQVGYVNRRIQKIITRLLSQPGQKPVIILQGDHGSGRYLNWESITDSCMRERFSILNAYYLPPIEGQNPPTSQLYSSITPVNTFRLVLDTYFGTSLGLVKDVSIFSQYSKPFNFQTVDPSQLTQSCFPEAED